jgi:ribosomal protein S18
MDAERDFSMSEIELPKMQRNRRYNRRPNQTVPEYVDWKDVDFLKRFIPER